MAQRPAVSEMDPMLILVDRQGDQPSSSLPVDRRIHPVFLDELQRSLPDSLVGWRRIAHRRVWWLVKVRPRTDQPSGRPPC